MTIDTSAPLFTTTAEHLVETVTQARQALAVALRERDEARAEAAIQTRRGDALEAELWKASDGERVALNASAYWKARCLEAEAELHDRPTLELPRIPAEPEKPARRGRRRGKHE